MLGSDHGLLLLGRTEKTMKNFRQVFSSVVAETDTGHLLVHYRIPFCIVPLRRQLLIYDCDCDR